MMEELKPCPFCGGENVAISPYDGAKAIICMDCLCQSASYREDNALENAVSAWNRRAAPENKALIQEQQDADELIRTLIADKNVNPCEWCRTPDKGGETCRGCFPYEDSNECPSKFTAFSAKSSNEPLTLGQLRKMDVDMKNRRWVWIEALKPFSYEHKVSAYYQVQLDYTQGEAFVCGYPGLSFGFDYADYGKTWLAYARKPEGSENP